MSENNPKGLRRVTEGSNNPSKSILRSGSILRQGFKTIRNQLRPAWRADLLLLLLLLFLLLLICVLLLLLLPLLSLLLVLLPITITITITITFSITIIITVRLLCWRACFVSLGLLLEGVLRSRLRITYLLQEGRDRAAPQEPLGSCSQCCLAWLHGCFMLATFPFRLGQKLGYCSSKVCDSSQSQTAVAQTTPLVQNATRPWREHDWHTRTCTGLWREHSSHPHSVHNGGRSTIVFPRQKHDPQPLCEVCLLGKDTHVTKSLMLKAV